MARDRGPLSKTPNKCHPRRAPMVAEARARPSAEIRMRAPPCRGEKNRKNHRRPVNSALVNTANQAGTQTWQHPLGHFHELMESPCTNHDYPVKHLYKDCELLKRLL